MSSELSEDEYNYTNYNLEFYEEDEGPPLIKKRSRLIAAVVQNNVDVLRDLLDSPKWYTVRDKMGYNLLQIAILQERREVFDYMLSLPDFPFDALNRHDETALDVAVTGFVSNDIWVEGYFARELVKKGVFYTQQDNLLLQNAIERSFTEVAKLLIEKGVDVNAFDEEGNTPLQNAVWENNAEIVTMLLIYGADPFVSSSSGYTLFEQCSPELQEVLFYYIYDRYSNLEIHLEVLLSLAKTNQFLFDEVHKTFNINRSKCDARICFETLCLMDTESLKLVLSKFSHYIKEVFSLPFRGKIILYNINHEWPLENLQLLLEGDLRDDFINFINTLDSSPLLERLINHKKSEFEISEILCFLLSYGLEIVRNDLHLIYSEFGYCNLFKILLHMDIFETCDYVAQIMPLFIYDVTSSLEDYLDFFESKEPSHFSELCSYFCHPTLIEKCERAIADGELEPKTFQQIPLLVELARNTFRKFFVKKFQIKTSRRFYSLLNCLPISTVHKKIITYETKLY